MDKKLIGSIPSSQEPAKGPGTAVWYCVRQRAGPFVKAFSTDNYRLVERLRTRSSSHPALSGTSLDRLELRLALFGYDGIFYTLTFSDETLPKDVDGVRRAWNAFMMRVRRWRKDVPLDFYVYRIEGLHGDARYHIHAFFRDQDLPPAAVRYLWTCGFVDDEPFDEKRVLAEKGYRCLARYFTKERPEVGRHSWGASRKLKTLIPPPEVRPSGTGRISIPRNAVLLPVSDDLKKTGWGYYQYARYLLPGK